MSCLCPTIRDGEERGGNQIDIRPCMCETKAQLQLEERWVEGKRREGKRCAIKVLIKVQKSNRSDIVVRGMKVWLAEKQNHSNGQWAAMVKNILNSNLFQKQPSKIKQFKLHSRRQTVENLFIIEQIKSKLQTL